MKARWSVICAKCDTTITVGDTIKPQYKRAGMNLDTGRPAWVRVPKAYVHAPKCPKVTPNRPGQLPRNVDPRTGEILVADLAPTQLMLGEAL
jgi:hypothetical protein